MPDNCPAHKSVEHDIEHLEKKYDSICQEFKSCKEILREKVGMKLFMWLFGLIFAVVIGANFLGIRAAAENKALILESNGKVMKRITETKEEMTKERSVVLTQVNKIQGALEQLDKDR